MIDGALGEGFPMLAGKKQIGECSHAARELGSLGVAPGTPETLDELSDPVLRPRDLAIDYPSFLESFILVNDVALDYDILPKCCSNVDED